MTRPLRIWAADRILVCVPADLPEHRSEALRDLLARTPAVDGVLELLSAEGLAATPPFVCAAAEGDGVRVVIRGGLEAVAHGHDGSSLTLSAGRSSTWNDDVVADIAAISVALGAEGSRFEWLATADVGPVPVAVLATTPAPAAELATDDTSSPIDDAPPTPAPAPDPAPVAPAAWAPEPVPAIPAPLLAPEPDADPHTLDEAAFLLLRDPPEAPPADPSPEVSAPAPAPAPIPGGLDFSQLLDETSHRPPPIPDLPPPPLPPPPGPPPGAEPATEAWIPDLPPPPPSPAPPVAGTDADAGTGLGEHDGRTITLADLRRLQSGDAPAPAASPDAPTARAREVRAVRCPAGHPNPPTAAACRRCGAELTDRSVVTVPRPVVARLVFESGLVVDVDRPQLIGRRPMTPAEADDLPNLVTIPSPDGDISRGHTAVRLEGWDVLIEDLGSTNGTEVQLPGADVIRLREHEPVLAVVGTRVTLAGTVRFTIQAPE